MATSEKTGCIFRKLNYIHSSEVCVAESCMICNEGMWEQSILEIFPPIVHEMPQEYEEDIPRDWENECELDGRFVANRTLICEKGECGICFNGEWLLPGELE